MKSWLKQCYGSGIRCLFDPGIRDGKKVEIRIRDPGLTSRIMFPRALKHFFRLKILKFFDADLDSGSGIFLIRDGKIRIRDKHPGSVTLIN